MGTALKMEELDNGLEMTEPEHPSVRSPEFDELVLSHTDMLYAVAMKLTRNSTDAEDLTQNTLLKALRFHDKFQQGSYIKAWLLTILRNTFINDYRRKVRWPAQVPLTGTEPAPDNAADPHVNYEPRGSNYADVVELLDDQVRRAIEELPDDFRMAVIMADIEDKSYKEIADIMHRPIGTVMSRLFRGRRLLREKLGDYAHQHGVSSRCALSKNVEIPSMHARGFWSVNAEF